MSGRRLDTYRHQASRTSAWLARPLSTPWCVFGWLVATGIFVAITSTIGIPSEGDARVSVFIGWALAHGHFACGYPPGYISQNLASPIYPIVSGVGSVLLRAGHGVPFPNGAALGRDCASSYAAMDQWADRSGAWGTTLRIGYVGWFALMLAGVWLLRAMGRGRTRLEPAALVLLALTPPASMCLVEYFHPQDLLAMGLALGALAYVIRGRWGAAGALIGLALVTQQFTLLILAPLLVLLPRSRRTAFMGSLTAAVAVVALPVVIFSDGRAIRSIVLGTGGQLYSSSLFDETGLHRPLIFVLARFLPIAIALILTWWARERLGERLLEPGLLLSLVATCLCLRLVFEVNVIGYYFMAVAVALILGDVARGRFRVSLVLWLLAVLIVTLNVFDTDATSSTVVLGQVLLVASAIVLALGPLLTAIPTALRHDSTTRP